MKRFAILFISVAVALLSSCALFIVNDEDHPRKDGGDTISITITHGIENDGNIIQDAGK
jgi:hypothetical protein